MRLIKPPQVAGVFRLNTVSRTGVQIENGEE